MQKVLSPLNLLAAGLMVFVFTEQVMACQPGCDVGNSYQISQAEPLPKLVISIVWSNDKAYEEGSIVEHNNKRGERSGGPKEKSPEPQVNGVCGESNRTIISNNKFFS